MSRRHFDVFSYLLPKRPAQLGAQRNLIYLSNSMNTQKKKKIGKLASQHASRKQIVTVTQFRHFLSLFFLKNYLRNIIST